MSDGAAWERTEAEIRALRTELAELRNGQEKLARAVAELTETFRTLAVHLGIASEPYRKGEKAAERPDVPGFG